jgi:hypothetical protein
MEILLGIILLFVILKVMFVVTSVFLRVILGFVFFLIMGLILPIFGILIIPLLVLGFFVGILKIIF